MKNHASAAVAAAIQPMNGTAEIEAVILVANVVIAVFAIPIAPVIPPNSDTKPAIFTAVIVTPSATKADFSKSAAN